MKGHEESSLAKDPHHNQVTEQDARDQLAKILASQLFSRSNVHSRFLKIVVDETLAGHAPKASFLLREVFEVGQANKSEPERDDAEAKVRVEARRLRDKLTDYYLTADSEDHVVIEIPKGGYRALFRYRHVIKPKQDKKLAWFWIPVAVLFLICVFFAGQFWARRMAARPVSLRKLLIGDLRNSTGEEIFDRTLRQGLFSVFEQSPFFTLISDDQVLRTLSMMGKDQNTPLDHSVGMQVCARTQGVALIEGSITRIDKQYVLALRAVNCSTGDLISERQDIASSKDQVLPVLGTLTNSVRRKLGESQSSINQFDTPLEDVTTPSLEALRAYTFGFHYAGALYDEASSIAFFERAIHLDPNFSMAYARLANVQSNLGESTKAIENITQAYAHRQHLSEREKLFIEAKYEFFGVGDLEKAKEAFLTWETLFPTDPNPSGNLNVIYYNLGQYDLALKAAKEYLRLNSDAELARDNVTYAYISLGRLADAKRIASETLRLHPEATFVHLPSYLIAFLNNDLDDMKHQEEAVSGKRGVEDVAMYYASDTAAYFGNFEKSRALTEKAAESAIRADEAETAAEYYSEAAVREALIGNVGDSRRFEKLASHLARGRDVLALSGIALALTGDVIGSGARADELKRRFPADTIVQHIYLPLIDAAQQLFRKGDAVKALAPALPYDFSSPTTINVALYTKYFRGLAKLAQHHAEDAIPEFEAIAAHSGVVLNEPIGALAKLELARALAASGQKSTSREEYVSFGKLWSNCDKSVLLCRQAKVEINRISN